MSKEHQHEIPAPSAAPAVCYEIDRVLIQVVVAAKKRGVKFGEIVLPQNPVAILPDPDVEAGFGATLERALPHFAAAAKELQEKGQG